MSAFGSTTLHPLFSFAPFWEKYIIGCLHPLVEMIFLLPDAEATCALVIFVGVIAVVRHGRLIQ
jgi:hypothetical protein